MIRDGVQVFTNAPKLKIIAMTSTLGAKNTKSGEGEATTTWLGFFVCLVWITS